MFSAGRKVDGVAASDERDGPLPSLLLVLTIVTGLVDAISYLKLGHVFVANMTGNVIFLGLAVAGATDVSVAGSLVATAAFMAGALLGGRFGSHVGRHRGRLLATATYVEIALVTVALILSIIAIAPNSGYASMVLIASLALAMGLQNATARRLAVPDLTTTVLTLTLTGLAADSRLARGSSPNAGRRMMATAAMCAGAAVGAFLLLHVGVGSVLALTLALLVAVGFASYRTTTLSDAWTIGK